MTAQRISSRFVDGRLEVTVDDDELFDFLDDFLVERGLDDFSIREDLNNGSPTYAMLFEPGSDGKAVLDAISELDPDEIERVWRLNNG